MGAMTAASTAGAVTGMAGMATTTESTSHVPAVTRVLRAVGLGGLTQLPNAVLQPLLIALLLLVIGAALWRAYVARTARAIALGALIVGAAAGLYASIYLTVSEVGYWLALTLLLLATLLAEGRPRLLRRG
jgi:hypothetical protein